MPADVPSPSRRQAVLVSAGVFLVSCAMLSFQVLQTVVLSLQIFPQSAFLVVSLSMLGLGAGGSFALGLTRTRGFDPLRAMWIAAVAFGVSLVPVMAATSRMHGLLGLIVVNVVPFVAAGLFLALAFGAWPQRANAIYFVDLVGAGLGCLVIVGLLNGLADAGLTIIVIASVALLAAALVGLAATRVRCGITTVIALGCLATVPVASCLFVFGPEPGKFYGQLLGKGTAGARVERQQWNFLGRLDAVVPGPAVADFDFARTTKVLLDEGCDFRFLFSNGYNWSFVIDFRDNARQRREFFARSPHQMPYLFTHAPAVLNVGSGGGVDVYLAATNGARSVTAVEINPLMITACTRWYPHFWDGVWSRPGVSLHEMDARTFVNTTDERYDIITLNAVDTSTTEMSLLSVNFLYTTEAFARYLDRLEPGGVIFLTRPRDQLLRALTGAVSALRLRDAGDIGRHVAVVGTGELLSAAVYRDPLSDDQIARIAQRVGDGFLGGGLQYLPGTVLQANPFTGYFAAVAAGEEAAHGARSPLLLEPTTDDKPYFYQLEPRFFGSRAGRTLITILILVGGIGEILIFLPLLRFPMRGRRAELAGNLTYFVCLGVGFMLVEICLMQRLSLLLGHPTYSVSVTLAGMLVFSGLGSIVAGMPARRDRLLIAALACIVVALTVYAVALDRLAYGALRQLGARVLLAIAVVAPGSFFLGMPFPLKLRQLDGRLPGLVPWAWAVNGLASVAGSVIAVMLAMNLGFRAVLLCAASCYLVALLVHLGTERVGAA